MFPTAKLCSEDPEEANRPRARLPNPKSTSKESISPALGDLFRQRPTQPLARSGARRLSAIACCRLDLLKLAAERLNTSHGVCKILIAGWPPPVPDLLKSHRQSRKRFPGFPARKRELRGARNRAHVLTWRARAILPHHPAVFQVRDARPVRRMNGFPEISTHGGFPGNPDPLLPGANEGDGIGTRQFFQTRASRPVAAQHYSQPHNHCEDDRPKQYLGSHRIAAYLAEKSQEQIL